MEQDSAGCRPQSAQAGGRAVWSAGQTARERFHGAGRDPREQARSRPAGAGQQDAGREQASRPGAGQEQASRPGAGQEQVRCRLAARSSEPTCGWPRTQGGRAAGFSGLDLSACPPPGLPVVGRGGVRYRACRRILHLACRWWISRWQSVPRPGLAGWAGRRGDGTRLGFSIVVRWWGWWGRLERNGGERLRDEP